MNLRPSGYEPDELPGCSTPRQIDGHWRAVGNGRAGRKAPVANGYGLGVFRFCVFVIEELPRFAGLATTYSPVS